KTSLTYAGNQADIFSDAAIEEIHQYTNGTPRLINKVCTHCLMYGSQSGHRIIDDHMVKDVITGEFQ
ncbi:hypothetical protein SAMN04488054_1616, partial [Salibacterium qingdaonense]